MVERLLFVVDRLEQFPRSGRVVPEFKRPNLREVILDAAVRLDPPRAL